MALIEQSVLEARKTPVQARSTFTVEAIFEAAIQVLLEAGSERLTTTRVAARAGVSVGTLYQYYPNKQALLFAIIELHLGQLAEAIERVCTEQRGQPLEPMVTAVVAAFMEAKMRRPEASRALYGVASELNGLAVSQTMGRRGRVALAGLLQTIPGVKFADVEFTASMLMAALGGASRMVLEGSEKGPDAGTIEMLREHLVLMCRGYLLLDSQTPVASFQRKVLD